jgi:hypothetical protein
MPTFKRAVETHIESCARCGCNHSDVTLKPFVNPIGVFTHWVMCPVLNEPILMQMKENPKDDAQN